MSALAVRQTVRSIAVRFGPAAAQQWINDKVPVELKPVAFATLMGMLA